MSSALVNTLHPCSESEIMKNRNLKTAVVAALALGSVASFAALPAGGAAIATEIGTDAAAAAAIGAGVMLIIKPLSIGFNLLASFIRKGSKT